MYLKNILLTMFSLVFLMAQSFIPKQDQIIVISAMLNGRTDAKFVKGEHDHLIKNILTKGTKALIVEVKKLPSGNYAVRVVPTHQANGDPFPADKVEASWVYYNDKNPSLKFLCEADVENCQAPKTPTVKKRAETTKDIPTVRMATPEERKEKKDKSQSTVTAIDNVILGNKRIKEAIKAKVSDYDCKMNLYQKMSVASGNCNPKNSYIEMQIYSHKFEPDHKMIMQNILATNTTETLVRSGVAESLNPLCVKRSMERFSSHGAYTRCGEKGKNHRSRNNPRPCITDNYVNFVTNSFNTATECLKSHFKLSKGDLETVFGLISIESGFHPNAKSHTGAGGIGQMTGDAIKHLNNTSINETISYLKSRKDNELCRQIGENFTKMDAGSSCARTSTFEGHPLKNIIYTMAMYSTNKEEIRKRFKRPPSDEGLQILGAWAHNVGWGGIAAASRRVKPEEDDKSIISTISRWLRGNYEDDSESGKKNCDSRCKEVSTYYQKIVASKKDISSEVGVDKCIK